MSSMTSRECNYGADGRYQEGDLVGEKYELVRKAGEGAMGVVWVATNVALDAKVAIKVIHPEMRSPALSERLLREARAAAMLTHSASVRVFDLGETSRHDPYIVMELIEGESLRNLLDREGPMSAERALAVLLPVVGAMQEAHERGIVHRDLKPDNIMLAQAHGGRIQPKVVDFGIAKLTCMDHGPKATGSVLIGTPEYMPPEQAIAGDAVDHRADIWSLCALLYELVSGQTPFPAATAWGALRALMLDPVPSLAESGVVDEALWAILERGLRKEPAERWPSMRSLGEALATWLSSRGAHEDVCGVSLWAQWLGDGGVGKTETQALEIGALVAAQPPAEAAPFSQPIPLMRRANVEEREAAPLHSRATESAISPVSITANFRGLTEVLPRRRFAVAAMALLIGLAAWTAVPRPLGGAGDSASRTTLAGAGHATAPASGLAAPAGPSGGATARDEPPIPTTPPAPVVAAGKAVSAPQAVASAPSRAHRASAAPSTVADSAFVPAPSSAAIVAGDPQPLEQREPWREPVAAPGPTTDGPAAPQTPAPPASGSSVTDAAPVEQPAHEGEPGAASTGAAE